MNEIIAIASDEDYFYRYGKEADEVEAAYQADESNVAAEGLPPAGNGTQDETRGSIEGSPGTETEGAGYQIG